MRSDSFILSSGALWQRSLVVSTLPNPIDTFQSSSCDPVNDTWQPLHPGLLSKPLIHPCPPSSFTNFFSNFSPKLLLLPPFALCYPESIVGQLFLNFLVCPSILTLFIPFHCCIFTWVLIFLNDIIVSLIFIIAHPGPDPMSNIIHILSYSPFTVNLWGK